MIGIWSTRTSVLPSQENAQLYLPEIIIISTFFYCLDLVYRVANGGEGEKSLAAFSFLYLLAGETAIKGSNYAD